jgi:hypothetical protein
MSIVLSTVHFWVEEKRLSLLLYLLLPCLFLFLLPLIWRFAYSTGELLVLGQFIHFSIAYPGEIHVQRDECLVLFASMPMLFNSSKAFLFLPYLLFIILMHRIDRSILTDWWQFEQVVSRLIGRWLAGNY